MVDTQVELLLLYTLNTARIFVSFDTCQAHFTLKLYGTTWETCQILDTLVQHGSILHFKNSQGYNKRGITKIFSKSTVIENRVIVLNAFIVTTNI